MLNNLIALDDQRQLKKHSPEERLTNKFILNSIPKMAAKRKKSDEIWLKSSSDQLVATDYPTEFELSVEKYLELKQRIELLEEEKEKNLKKLRQLELTIQEADTKCADHLKQLVELKHLVTDLEAKLETKSEQYDAVIKQLTEEKAHYLRQEEKWQVFQKDLLTTVRVANDLKTEAEEQSVTLLNENRTLSEKIANLESELGSLRMNIADDATTSDRTNQNEGQLNQSQTNRHQTNSSQSSPNQPTNKPSTTDIIFRKKPDNKQASTKRNANCFTDLNNSLGNGPVDSRSNERSAAGNKLLRQQSADSVFSLTGNRQLDRRPDKFASSRNSASQSMKSISAAIDPQSKAGKKSQISVKTLVETIENASKPTAKTVAHQQVSSSPSSLILVKSPSFNSINLNSNATDKIGSTKPFDQFADRPVSLNAKLQPLLENGTGKLNKFDHKYDEKLNQLPSTNAQNEEKLMNKLNDRTAERNCDSINKLNDKLNDKFSEKLSRSNDDKIGYKSTSIFGDKLTGAKLNDKLNKMDKLDKYESIKSKYNKELMRTRLHKKENNCPPIKLDEDLNSLIKDGGSKRNALLKWCQNKTRNYDGIDITNFSR